MIDDKKTGSLKDKWNKLFVRVTKKMRERHVTIDIVQVQWSLGIIMNDPQNVITKRH